MAHNDITDFDGADIIDIRDVIARVEELREELTNVKDEVGEQEQEMGLNEWCISIDKNNHPFGDSVEELQTLEDLLGELRGYGGDEQWGGDWYPATLIKESYFEEYMDDMLEDIGDLPKNIPSYLKIVVDYDALKQDYSEVEFEGNTYYYR
jgi:hypothetical protein